MDRMALAHAARLFCTFRLGERLFGVDVLAVKEVNREMTFTAVPHAPAAVRGFANLRGQIHLVLDLRQLLGLPPAVVGPDSRLVTSSNRSLRMITSPRFLNRSARS